MLNKVSAFISQQQLIAPKEHIICAVSGGADSVALLFCLYLLREKWDFSLSAAHLNHGLRGVESDRDQDFVISLCKQFDIPLYCKQVQIVPGNKGLEAAAREARYGFFDTLPGKVATAHTADDNAETLLMHLIRGTGLRGLGGIAPKRDNLIRPMLSVTRQEVLSFLEEYHLQYVQDSSNDTDAYLRNRLRHHVMPLLKAENPSLSENLSAMALRLRQDAQLMDALTEGPMPEVDRLREMEQPLRSRWLCRFLQEKGICEPSSAHIRLMEQIVFSHNPSASALFPGNIRICREYNRLVRCEDVPALQEQSLPCPGTLELSELGLRIHCAVARETIFQKDRFCVYPQGEIVVRARKAGDTMRLLGGTKSLKELFVDKKIPAAQRSAIPVLSDSAGVLGVWQIGANVDRTEGVGTAVEVWFEPI